MEVDYVIRLQQSASEAAATDCVQQNLERLKYFAETGEAVHLWFIDETQWHDFTDLLGISEIEGSRVLATVYSNTAEFYEVANISPGFAGRWTLQELINSIADVASSWVEFMNNFKVKVTIGLDESAAIIVNFELDEQPGICDECQNNPEFMKLESEYNCGHGVDDTYGIRYSADVVMRESLQNAATAD